MSKVMSLSDGVGLIESGASIALGGNTFHRAPGAVIHELLRQRKTGLTLIKTAGSYDVDLLAGTGALERAILAYAGFETLGLAPRFRKMVESGQVTLQEHT
jgi:glutaconate CoA-transferase subunit A